MRLSELNPRWCNETPTLQGVYQGVTFDCPHCKIRRLGVWFDVPIGEGSPVDIEAFQKTLDCDHPDHQLDLHETHLTLLHWHREGDTFENLTLTPSIDASKFGCWHGFITNGEIS